MGNHAVSPGEEKERLQWERFAEKGGFNLKPPFPRHSDGWIALFQNAASGVLLKMEVGIRKGAWQRD